LTGGARIVNLTGVQHKRSDNRHHSRLWTVQLLNSEGEGALSLLVNKSAVARVLVADDMSTNRMPVKQVLGAPEFEVLEAENGVQVLEILRHEMVDVVLLDVMMPEMDGMETSKRIRGDLGLALLPIIMVTALGSSDDVALAIDHGADDYVTKPFEAVELRARVRAAVSRKHLVDRLDDMETVLLSLARMVEARDANTGTIAIALLIWGRSSDRCLGSAKRRSRHCAGAACCTMSASSLSRIQSF
jgi:PleD family two-component response regulator